MILLEGYKSVKTTSKEIQNLFFSADLDMNNMLGYYEFICLFKYIEKTTEEKALEAGRLFLEKCDVENSENDERCISLDNFLNLCIEN